jgi:tripartite-type tricarboxylate transporter receptor subunit TctC
VYRVFWALLFVAGVPAQAQDFPTRPLRIVTIEVGGGADFAVRLMSPGLSAALGQQVIVDNRATSIAPEIVAKAPPDGYTLLYFGTPVWILPLLQKTSYDPVRDFAPVTFTTSAPNILVVHPSLPVKSVQELIALARARPGALNYAAAGVGSAPHLAGELFKAMANVNIVAIPYKGGGPAVTDLVGGQVQMMFSSASSVANFIKSGKLNPIAVTSAHPSAVFPGVPTVASSGLPGYESASMQGIWAPRSTPPALVRKLNQDIVMSLNQPEVRDRLFAAGVEVATSTPGEFSDRIKSEVAMWSKLIRDAGIHVTQ